MRLERDQLAELAALVADELEARGVASTSRPGAMVDAEELAARLGVERGWVYAHADELGARRLGDGPRARLRFDLAEALRAATRCHEGRGSIAADAARGAGSARRRRRPASSGARLLPVRGVADA